MYLVGLLLMMACSKQEQAAQEPVQEQPVLEEEEAWRLAWRVWESGFLDTDYVVGAKQFDSLLRMTNEKPSVPIMLAGIQCYAETSQYTKAYEALMGYPYLGIFNFCNMLWFRPPATVQWAEMCDKMGPAQITLPEVRKNLIVMYINHHFARRTDINELIRETRYQISTNELYQADVQETDRINIEKLKIIIDEIGFPDQSMVGSLGIKSMLTIISEANQDPEFQASQLANIWQACIRGEIQFEDYAYLADQLEIDKGNAPIFGSHFATDEVNENRAVLEPAIDEKEANKRRMERGMMPLETLKRWRLYPLEQLENSYEEINE